MALATRDTVRSRGALQAPSTDAAAPSNLQIDAAILLAVTLMIALVGRTTYDEVVAWTNEQLAADPEKQLKKDAYVAAESYFAISKLPAILKNGQMAEGGLTDSTTVGQSTTRFAPVEEGQKIRRDWESLAMKELAPYLAVIRTDAEGKDLSANTKKKGGFTIMVI
jgi:hypothetical protein